MIIRRCIWNHFVQGPHSEHTVPEWLLSTDGLSLSIPTPYTRPLTAPNPQLHPHPTPTPHPPHPHHGHVLTSPRTPSCPYSYHLTPPSHLHPLITPLPTPAPPRPTSASQAHALFMSRECQGHIRGLEISISYRWHSNIIISSWRVYFDHPKEWHFCLFAQKAINVMCVWEKVISDSPKILPRKEITGYPFQVWTLNQ